MHFIQKNAFRLKVECRTSNFYTILKNSKL